MSIVTTILSKKQAPFNHPSTQTTIQISGTCQTHMWCACDTHVVCMWYPCDVHVIPITFHFFVSVSRCQLWQPFYGRNRHLSITLLPRLLPKYPDLPNPYVVCMWYPCGVHVIPMWCACDTHIFFTFVSFSRCWLRQLFNGRNMNLSIALLPRKLPKQPELSNPYEMCMWYPCDVHVIPVTFHFFCLCV